MAVNWSNVARGLFNPVQQFKNIFFGGFFEDPSKSSVDYDSALALAREEMAYNAAEAEKARLFSAEQAQIQRDYEERLANTSYQRMVVDASSAGLNPYLAYASGGAATPSGAVASTTSASYSGYAAAQLGAMSRLATANIAASTKISTTAMQLIGSLLKR